MTNPDDATGTRHPHLTGRVERVLRRGREEQQRLGHPELTAEHILHGLLADKLCVAQFVLRDLNVDARKLAGRLREELERGAPSPTVTEADVLHEALRWVDRLDQVSLGTEHVLLALVGSESVAARLLAEVGVEPAAAKQATERLIDIVPRRSGPGFRESGESEAQG
ncbi:MAG TPA: Clp protease N-terminal domain-containing protein [Gemmatimonadales bacterium]|nr:Clp protease N-terminal domain-containing protein [Gemmatimonadales bacterium]